MGDDFAELLESPASVLVPAGAGGERAIGGVFEGANQLNDTIALWGAGSPLASVDLEILPEKATIDGRARDMLRNDAFVQGGAALHKDSIIGSHYLLNYRPDSRALFGKVDEVWEAETQEEIESKWELDCDYLDASQTCDFTSFLRLGIGMYLMGGEILATAEWIPDSGTPFNTAIQMVDLDRLSDPQDRIIGWQSLPNQRAGIRYNSYGAPQSYFIRSAHPNDFGPRDFASVKWKEVDRIKPWGRQQVIHLFEQLRPDQSRGVTEMASALKAMKITHTWRDITVQHAVTQAMYAAAITSELPTSDIMARMGVGDSPEAAQAAITSYAEGYLGSVAKYVGTKGLAIDGVKIPRLYPGEKFDLKSAAGNGPLGGEFEQSLLRYIAASMGVSYEQLSRDYTNTNYSSARASMAETWKFMQSRKKLVADRLATMIFRLWFEEVVNAGKLETVKRIPIYDSPRRGQRYGRLNTNFEALTRCDWIGASRGQIDELKETQAAVLRINNGLSTAEDELGRLGKDWRKVYRQLKREQELRETLNLTFMATDPATMAAMNALSATPSDDGDKPRE